MLVVEGLDVAGGGRAAVQLDGLLHHELRECSGWRALDRPLGRRLGFRPPPKPLTRQCPTPHSCDT